MAETPAAPESKRRKQTHSDEGIPLEPTSRIDWHYALAEALQRAELPYSAFHRLQLAGKTAVGEGPRMRIVAGQDDLRRLYAVYESYFSPDGRRQENDNRPAIMKNVDADVLVVEDRNFQNVTFADVVEEGAFSHVRELYIVQQLPYYANSVYNLFWAVCETSKALETLSIRLDTQYAKSGLYERAKVEYLKNPKILPAFSVRHLEMDEWQAFFLGLSKVTLSTLEHLVLHIEQGLSGEAEADVVPSRGAWRTMAPNLLHFSIVLEQTRPHDQVRPVAMWPEISQYGLPDTVISVHLARSHKYESDYHADRREAAISDDSRMVRSLIAHFESNRVLPILQCLSLDIQLDPVRGIPSLNPAAWSSLQKLRVRTMGVLQALLRTWHGRRLSSCTIVALEKRPQDVVRELQASLPGLRDKTVGLVRLADLADSWNLQNLEQELGDVYGNPYNKPHVQTRIEDVLSKQFRMEIVLQRSQYVSKFPYNTYV